MKTNKLWSIMMMLVLVLGTMVAFSSCGEDDDEISGNGGGGVTSGLIGTWHSTNTGPTGRSCIVTFNSNKTVEIEASSRASYKNFQGTYTVSGSTIKCKGVSATVYYSDGEESVDPNSTTSFTYSNGKLSGGFYSDCDQFSK